MTMINLVDDNNKSNLIIMLVLLHPKFL